MYQLLFLIKLREPIDFFSPLLLDKFSEELKVFDLNIPELRLFTEMHCWQLRCCDDIFLEITLIYIKNILTLIFIITYPLSMFFKFDCPGVATLLQPTQGFFLSTLSATAFPRGNKKLTNFSYRLYK